ncbi:UNVERIFIED_CONTAM: hypothetical protein Slati_2907100 [Sesamum latifolium]|uniref:RNase H type-1 domain-containing protein n=1 Tax=Sesamum latifolium TaxID=2727402 RepID=A0AAW2VDX7_9LAMI
MDTSSTFPSFWIRHRFRSVKINFYAAFRSECGHAGVGVIVRDAQGECLYWMANIIPFVRDVETAEAWAFKSAAVLTSRFQNHTLVLEGIVSQ